MAAFPERTWRNNTPMLYDGKSPAGDVSAKETMIGKLIVANIRYLPASVYNGYHVIDLGF